MDISQKLYAIHILNRLINWVNGNAILTPLQAGFRPKNSTVDQVFRLFAIYTRYVVYKKQSLYITFIDLRAAFDLVPRNILWKRFDVLGAPAPLISAIRHLHSNNFAKIQWGLNGEITNEVPILRGVRQGCVLAHTLFSLYLNEIDQQLLKCVHNCPIIGGLHAPILLFADDSILISRTASGLQNLTVTFCAFLDDRGLEINVKKTKCMCIRNSKGKSYYFYAKGARLENVHSIDYLGIWLNSKMTWSEHLSKSQTVLKQCSGAVLKLNASSSTKAISPALANISHSGPDGSNVWL